MIQKLRKKFILVNMSLISVVILTALILMCLSNYQKIKNQTEQSLTRALEMNNENFKPIIEKNDHSGQLNNKIQDGKYTVVFTVEVDDEGNIQSVNDTGVDVSTYVVESVVEQVIKTQNKKGFIKSPALSYLVQKTDTGKKIAFADCSNDIASMKSLILNTSLVFAGLVIVFFIISWFLAKWIVKPVEIAWEKQRQFVADASHELKTPLTVILANLGIIKTHPNDSIHQQKQWLENTEAEAVRMKELLGDLLFLAKNDAAKMPVLMIKQDFSNLLLGCILLFESIAYERNIELTENITENLWVKGDEKQLKQLIGILLDNACKYAKGGKVSVNLTQKQDKVCLAINNSINNKEQIIPKEDLEHIFERFYRVDKSRVRKEGGYGLGLSIAKAIVDAHKGKIKVTSNLVEGTTFFVSFSK